MITVAVCNHKGGSGKTTTSVNLAAALAELGKSTLVVDLDPQAAASRWLGAEDGGRGLLEVFTGEQALADLIVPTDTAGLALVPSTALLGGAEKALAGEIGAETLLRRSLRTLGAELARRASRTRWEPEVVTPAEFLRYRTGDPRKVWEAKLREARPAEREALSARRRRAQTERARATRYDWVLLDCPPTMGVLLVNALAAADRVLVPVEAHFMGVVGLAQLLETVGLVRQRLNEGLELLGIVGCRLDARARHGPEVLASLRAQYGEGVCETIIRQNVRLAESPGHRAPITSFAPRSAGAEDHRALARELLGRLG
jgi:chromosome partitioning protein